MEPVLVQVAQVQVAQVAGAVLTCAARAVVVELEYLGKAQMAQVAPVYPQDTPAVMAAAVEVSEQHLLAIQVQVEHMVAVAVQVGYLVAA